MGRKSKKGRSVKRNLAVNSDEPDELKRAPHSFVIHRGRVGNYILELVKDFRKVMEPFTASSLQARKKNLIKDYVSIAGIMHVSHLCIFTHTEVSTYLKIVRLPRGPTLTFKVHNYSLARDVVSTIKKQLVFTKQFEHSPLIVLNGFSGEGIHMKLMTSMFQNMFPTINLLKVNLNNIRRCVLFSFNPTSKLIDFRHYAIKVVPAGISKGVKKIVQSKVPNLGRYESVSDYLTNPAQLSDSEAEDDPASHVTLPQKLSSRGNAAASTSAIRLVEMGPRLTLELLKVEEGLLGGEVLHHELVEKTEEEKKLIKLKREQKRKLKEKRKKIQEENKKQKELKKEMHKQKSLKGMQKRSENEVQMLKAVEEANQNADEDDNDVEWYKEEVGQNPDSGSNLNEICLVSKSQQYEAHEGAGGGRGSCHECAEEVKCKELKYTSLSKPKQRCATCGKHCCTKQSVKTIVCHLFSTTTPALKKKRFIPYKVKRRKGLKSDQPKKKVRFG